MRKRRLYQYSALPGMASIAIGGAAAGIASVYTEDPGLLGLVAAAFMIAAYVVSVWLFIKLKPRGVAIVGCTPRGVGVAMVACRDINACALGFRPAPSIVLVGAPLTSLLDDEALAGVIAHEEKHAVYMHNLAMMLSMASCLAAAWAAALTFYENLAESLAATAVVMVLWSLAAVVVRRGFELSADLVDEPLRGFLYKALVTLRLPQNPWELAHPSMEDRARRISSSKAATPWALAFGAAGVALTAAAFNLVLGLAGSLGALVAIAALRRRDVAAHGVALACTAYPLLVALHGFYAILAAPLATAAFAAIIGFNRRDPGSKTVLDAGLALAACMASMPASLIVAACTMRLLLSVSSPLL